MMRVTMLIATLMAETAVDTMPTLIFVLTVDAISMRLVLLVLIPLLGMVSVMTRPTMIFAILMLETAVGSIPIMIFAQIALVGVRPFQSYLIVKNMC